MDKIKATIDVSPDFSPGDAMIAQDFCRQRVPEPAPYLIRGPKA